MLTWLTRGMRYWAATGLVALYALCVLAPVAAFAFGDTKASLIEANHGLGAAPVQHDGLADKHSHGSDEGATGKCCGLVCLSAMAPAIQAALVPPMHLAIGALEVDDGLRGSVPDRLHRPPISLLSL